MDPFVKLGSKMWIQSVHASFDIHPPSPEPSKRANRAETVIESPPSQRRSSTVKRRHSLSIIQDATEAT